MKDRYLKRARISERKFREVISTGHVIEFADRATVSAIVAEAKENNYGLRSLVHAVVQSDTFLNK